MTSTQSQSATTPAQNTTAAPTAPSYASAAGATKKTASTPLVVTGATPPTTVEGSSIASSQNASTSVNGRQSIPPAIPTIANGASSLNGDSTDHNPNGSVSITAPGNGFANAAPGIQFGFDKTPQPSSAVPMPTSGVGHPQQIPSPALSPVPIPQPSASGGKPGATESQFKIGSYNNDTGDVHQRMMAMRGHNPTSIPFVDHTRRNSNASFHSNSNSDMGHHGGPSGPGRGGFAGRGRGSYNNPQYNQQTGFPPQQNYRGPPFVAPNRGGMISSPAGYPRGSMGYPNHSPRLPHGSPALSHAIPGQGTPNMTSAMPVPALHPQGPGNQFPPPMTGYGYAPQVGHPFLRQDAPPSLGHKNNKNKNKGPRRDSENRQSIHPRRPDLFNQSFTVDGGMSQRFSKRQGSTADYDRPYGPSLTLEHQEQPHSLVLDLDLAPGPDKFERVHQMLTDSNQAYTTYHQGFDHRQQQQYGMPNYVQQGMFQGSPNQNFYSGSQFQAPPPQAQSMSRGNSQISERPASSTGQVGSSASGPPSSGMGPSIASPAALSTQFLRPKKAAIVIKNAAGEEVNFKALKTPASPAPSAQQSKTPPVVASTPTPPPKAPTPASQTRSESATNADAAKSKAAEIQAAFAAQVKEKADAEEKVALQAAVDEQPKQDEELVQATQKAADDKAAEAKAAEVKAAEVKAAEVKAAEAKAAEAKAAEAKAKEDAEKKAKADADEKAKTDADEKAKTDANEKAKADAESAEKAKPEADNAEPAFPGMLPGESEDDYFDRLDRESAAKEAEQAEITKKKNAEKEAAKKAAEGPKTDREFKELEREMERIEAEKEKAREQREKSGETKSVNDLLAGISNITASQKKDASNGEDKTSKLTINSSLQAPSSGSAPSSAKSTGKDRRPAALNLAPLKTGSVEAPPPSAAMQALKSSRFLTIKDEFKYPAGIASPNPATNAAAAKKGGSFKYDSTFLLQFQKVFTEQPSTEFSQQVKALIGESDGGRSASTRGSRGLEARSNSKSAAGGGAFGAFTQPVGGKALPPGTTSDQRFAISQGQMARPAMGGPMASFGGRGTFPSGSQMGRAPSGMGMGSRQGSTRTTQPRGNSKAGRGYESEKLAKTMPLTANMDLKPIQVTTNGWKPMSLQNNGQQQPTPGTDLLDPATVQRKVKSNLNKMTPENFDKISGQILQIAAQSKDEQDGRTLRQVIQLTFEKATDEAHWAAMYAKFCQCMLENMSPEVKDVTITDKQGNVVSGGALFRKYLLNRCQEDFERGWTPELPKAKDGETKEAALMSDEYYKAMAIKRRGLGLIQFIGELFRLGMLTERIMHECLRKLLDFKDEPDEAEIESLTKLLRTIGADLDNTEKSNSLMNAYFQRIQNLVETPNLPSRLSFMLMDIIDLRKAKWVSKDGLKGPKTRDEIRADAEAAMAAKAAEQSRSNNNRGYQGQGQGRFNSGRGDSRNHFQPTQASNNVAMDDLRRLKGSASRTASGNVTLGPTSMFNSRSNSGRTSKPGGALTRNADDSGGSSRTGTPGPATSSNTFAALAHMNEEPASPPPVAASPALNHAKPDKSAT